MRQQRLTAIIEREDGGFVSLCPELDVASQGSSIEEARTNLVEALTLFFETADPSKFSLRYHGEVFCYPGRGTDWVGFESFRARRFAGILEQNGFVKVRLRGSHRIMQKAD